MKHRASGSVLRSVGIGAGLLILQTVSLGQALDEHAIVSVNGVRTAVRPDGSFTLSNVPTGQNLVQVSAISVLPGITLYGSSEFVQVLTQPVTISNLVLSPLPLPSFLAITAAPDPIGPLVTLGETRQVKTIGYFTDGSAPNISPRSLGSTYVSSNSAIVSVDLDGLATANARGVAFITVSNRGTTTVTPITVSLGDPLTTVEGFVFLDGSTPVDDATVRLPILGGMDVTDADGGFCIGCTGGGIASQLGAISILALADVAGESLNAYITPGFEPNPGGLTDVGVIYLNDDFYWISGTSGAWGTGTNWSMGTVPVAGEDVIIGQPIVDLTVTLTAASGALNSLLCNESLTVSSGGDLSVVQPFQVALTFTLTGGTISNSTVQSDFVLVNTGTLDGVVLDAGTLIGNSETLTIQNGLTLNGTVELNDTDSTFSSPATLSFVGTQTLGGSGDVFFDFVIPSNGNFVSVGSGNTLTIGPDMTIHGESGQVGNGGATLVIQGTIRADVSGHGITVTGASNSNQGLLESAGGQLSISGSWADIGMVKGTSGSVRLASALTNNGSILILSGSTLQIDGTFDPGTGTLTTGGTTDVRGLYLNSGRTIPLDGTWRLTTGGTIQGGTIDPGTGGTLLAEQGTLDGVVLNGNAFIGNQDTLTIQNGLTLNGTLELNDTDSTFSSPATLSFVGTQTLGGSGDVFFDFVIPSNGNFVSVGSGNTLTIGPDMAIHGESGQVGSSGATLVIQGTIRADVSGHGITVTGASNSNQGLLESAGGQLIISGSWVDIGMVEATSGSVRLASALTNNGSIVTSPGGTFLIDNTFDPGTGTLTNGGTVNVSALYLNAGRTIPLDGTWRLSGSGEIQGGTIDPGTGGNLLAELGTLNGVVLNGDAFIGDSDTLTIQNGLTLNGSIELNDTNSVSSTAATLSFAGTQTLGGNGDVFFDFVIPSNGNFVSVGSGNTLTIGSDMTVHGETGTVGSTTATLVNEGTIRADVSGHTITVRGMSNSNQGLLESAGGQLDISGSWVDIGMVKATSGTVRLVTALTNDGSIETSPGGTLLIDGTFDPGTGSLTNGGTVDISAPYQNGGRTIVLDGTWRLSGSGEVQGGTIDPGTGGDLQGVLGTLNGVVLNGDASVADSDTLSIQNGLTLNGTILIHDTNSVSSSAATLNFVGTQALSGTGDVLFDFVVPSNGNFVSVGSGDTLTIGAGMTIHGETGTVGSTAATLLNQGTIRADVTGHTITVRGTSWSNQGNIEAKGGSISTNGSWSNAGTVLVGFNNGFAALSDYSATAGATTAVELGGTSTSSYGTVVVTGTATVAGTLEVTLANGFTPSIGNVFDVVTAGTVVGTFSTVNLPAGSNWTVTYPGTAVRLTVVP